MDTGRSSTASSTTMPGARRRAARTCGATVSMATSSYRSIGGSRRRLHQQEHPLYLARRHARQRHPRQGAENRAAGRGFRRVPPRRRVLSSQHLVLADRLGRNVQHPHRPRHRPSFAPLPRPATRPTSRWANGTISRSPSEARRSRSRLNGKTVIAGPPSRASRLRAHRLPTPRRQESRGRMDRPSQPGAVQEYLYQRTERSNRSR